MSFFFLQLYMLSLTSQGPEQPSGVSRSDSVLSQPLVHLALACCGSGTRSRLGACVNPAQQKPECLCVTNTILLPNPERSTVTRDKQANRLHSGCSQHSIPHRAESVSRRGHEERQSCVRCCSVGLVIYTCTTQAQSLSREARLPSARCCIIKTQERDALCRRADKSLHGEQAVSLRNDWLCQGRGLQLLPCVLWS